MNTLTIVLIKFAIANFMSQVCSFSETRGAGSIRSGRAYIESVAMGEVGAVQLE